jgi:hypothetical protein
MARFSHLATQPARGPSDMLRWKVLDKLPGRRPPRAADFEALDRVRPGVREGGAEAFAHAAGAATLWIGHATWVLRLGGKRIAIDPHRQGPARAARQRRAPEEGRCCPSARTSRAGS